MSPVDRFSRVRRLATQANDTVQDHMEVLEDTGLVTESIKGPHQGGHVKIMGERWPAITADGSPVKEGAEVRVVEIRNSTLVVSSR